MEVPYDHLHDCFRLRLVSDLRGLGEVPGSQDILPILPSREPICSRSVLAWRKPLDQLLVSLYIIRLFRVRMLTIAARIKCTSDPTFRSYSSSPFLRQAISRIFLTSYHAHGVPS